MVNPDRMHQVRALLREAERLVQEESRGGAPDTKLLRLAALLWIGVDAAGELAEEYAEPKALHPRERVHFDHVEKEGNDGP